MSEQGVLPADGRRIAEHVHTHERDRDGNGFANIRMHLMALLRAATSDPSVGRTLMTERSGSGFGNRPT